MRSGRQPHSDRNSAASEKTANRTDDSRRPRKYRSRNYTCQCGYKQHRDIHGAMNLFAKVYYGEIRPLEFTVKPFTYRRIA
ncbi:zinc ribbon domain-containing protein [Geobacillus stearothermophilus]|nr:zinc ribbon domain-containing protein [Geobacillus stearothermophilus]MDF9297627.1 zinc ribbon domain-containing protein [Geobacillus stearothermophilus]